MEPLTKEDLISFKLDLIVEIKEILSNNKPPEESEYLTTSETKSMLRVSTNSLVKIRNVFGLKRIQILGKFYYLKSEIQALLEQKKEKKKL